MSLDILWFIPTHGDGRYLGTSIGGRAITPQYLRQLAGAIDHLGYAGALLPTGRSCEDAWITAASLIPVTQRMKFLVAIRPGISSPGMAARMAATFDRMSNGRLLINIVTGGDPIELAGDGLHLNKALIWRSCDLGQFTSQALVVQGFKLVHLWTKNDLKVAQNLVVHHRF